MNCYKKKRKRYDRKFDWIIDCFTFRDFDRLVLESLPVQKVSLFAKKIPIRDGDSQIGIALQVFTKGEYF